MTIKYDQYEDKFKKTAGEQNQKMSEEVHEIFQAVGLACEMAGMIREQMEANGFTREEACGAAAAYILSVLNPRGGDSCETD